MLYFLAVGQEYNVSGIFYCFWGRDLGLKGFFYTINAGLMPTPWGHWPQDRNKPGPGFLELNSLNETLMEMSVFGGILKYFICEIFEAKLTNL